MKLKNFVKLLLTRGLPLFFRPAAIVAEGYWLEGEFLIVVLLPLVAMVLILSSLPIHVGYFSAVRQPAFSDPVARSYASALTIVMAVAAVVAALVLSLGFPELSRPVIVAVVAFYLSEKYFDETSRFVEFQKRFGLWFLIQILRSAWLFVPIALATAGADYIWSFMCVALVVLILSLAIFVLVFRLQPQLNMDGLRIVGEKWQYILGSALPAVYRQVPRLLVASFFPSMAHIYLALAQITQSLSLAFDVRVLIPYRKISVRHPQLFHKAWRPLLRSMTMYCIGTALLYIVIAMILDVTTVGPMLLGALLLPVLSAEAMSFSLLNFNAGLVVWFVPKRAAIFTYILCLSVYGAVTLPLIATDSVSWPNSIVLLIPAVNLLIGLSWRMAIVYRHFHKAF